MRKIVLTGGGTAGHVTPNISLMNKLKDLQYEIHYIGQRGGIEESLIGDISDEFDVEFHKISAGKIRRQKSFTAMMQNFGDMFKVLSGIVEARNALLAIEPDVIFSKGGYVSVPVVLASKMAGIPIVIHESDITPGLTNKISLHFAENICVSFKETSEYIKKFNRKESVITGTPIRQELFKGDRSKGRVLCKFADDNKPKIVVMGGSQGSNFINQIVQKCIIEDKLREYNIIHLTGLKNSEAQVEADNYIQFDYLKQELPDVLAYADMVVSRAGANAIFELLALRKPNILIPLSRKVSRGDQLDNAKSFKKSGYSCVLQEEEVNVETLVKTINEVYKDRRSYIDHMKNSNLNGTIDKIIGVINASYK